MRDGLILGSLVVLFLCFLGSFYLLKNWRSWLGFGVSFFSIGLGITYSGYAPFFGTPKGGVSSYFGCIMIMLGLFGLAHFYALDQKS